MSKKDEVSLDEWVANWLDKFDAIQDEAKRHYAVKELILAAASQGINEYRILYKHSLN